MNTKAKFLSKRTYIIILCIFLLFLGAIAILFRDPFAWEAREITSTVEEHYASLSPSVSDDGTELLPGIVTTGELSESMQAHRDDIITPFTHDEWVNLSFSGTNDREIHRLITSANPDWDALFWYAAKEGCQYLACPTENGYSTQPDAFGYKKIGTSEYFDIYYHPEEDITDCWLISQHGDPNGNQIMFYTLENYQGQLIVVDGGWTTDAPAVRQTLKNLGNHVTAWILTHPHADHVGAFCEIYPAPGELQIDKVYTVDMASPELCLQNASWDDMSAYEQFLSLDIPQLTYVYTGDRFEIAGLDFHVLSAYEDNVDEISNDLLNDGSMMFKITADEESMLFCSDIGINMTDHLLRSVGEHIKAEYLQIGHHGNGGLADYFYREVAPKVTFFDAPNWLMEDPEDRFTTPENKQLMLEMGSEVYSFSTSPNQFILE